MKSPDWQDLTKKTDFFSMINILKKPEIVNFYQ